MEDDDEYDAEQEMIQENASAHEDAHKMKGSILSAS